MCLIVNVFFFSSRRRHTRLQGDWSSDVCSSDLADRRAEADEFYEELTPAGASTDEANVVRQALAGMLWSKQFFYYDVGRWLDGDPAQPPPPSSRPGGRDSRLRTFDAVDIMSMPANWEDPWFPAR